MLGGPGGVAKKTSAGRSDDGRDDAQSEAHMGVCHTITDSNARHVVEFDNEVAKKTTHRKKFSRQKTPAPGTLIQGRESVVLLPYISLICG